LPADVQARYAHRVALHRLLRGGALLPTSRLTAAQRYTGPVSTYRIRFDHLLPGAGWMRITADLSGPRGWDIGLLEAGVDDHVKADTGLRHLFLRHGVTPLLVLFDSVQNLVMVEILRLSRTFVGPFWFPGLPLPEHAPEALRDTLVLHMFQEGGAKAVHDSFHRDPWVPPTLGAPPPAGFGLFRERRFAVPTARIKATRQWADPRGGAIVVGF
jgi:hypothetical protein